MSRFAAVLLLFASPLISGLAWGQVTTSYAVVDLGVLSGDKESTAYGINEKGQVVGASGDENGGKLRAFVWTDGKMQALETPTGNASCARAINESGLIVGRYWKSTDHPFPCSWLNGKLTTLDSAGGEAAAVNDKGQIAGWAFDDEKVNRAATWLSGKKTLLHPSESWAQAINAKGDVVILACDESGGYRAHLWSGGKVTKLTVPAGADWTEAHGISDTGVAVGYVETGEGNQAIAWKSGKISYLCKKQSSAKAEAINNLGQAACTIGGKAYIWKGGKLEALPELPDSDSSEAYGINEKSWVVGASGGHAVLWKPKTVD